MWQWWHLLWQGSGLLRVPLAPYRRDFRLACRCVLFGVAFPHYPAINLCEEGWRPTPTPPTTPFFNPLLGITEQHQVLWEFSRAAGGLMEMLGWWLGCIRTAKCPSFDVNEGKTPRWGGVLGSNEKNDVFLSPGTQKRECFSLSVRHWPLNHEMWKKYTFIQARSKKITEKKKKPKKKPLHNRNSTRRAGPWSSDHGNLQEFTRIHSAASSCEGGARRAHEHTKTSIEQGKKSNSEVRREKNLFPTLFLPFNCTVWGTAGMFSLSVPCNCKAEILITANFKLGVLKLAS